MKKWGSVEGDNKFVTKKVIHNPDGSEIRVPEEQMPSFHNKGRTELRVAGLFPTLKKEMKPSAIDPDQAQDIIDSTKPELKNIVTEKLRQLLAENE